MIDFSLFCIRHQYFFQYSLWYKIDLDIFYHSQLMLASQCSLACLIRSTKEQAFCLSLRRFFRAKKEEVSASSSSADLPPITAAGQSNRMQIMFTVPPSLMFLSAHASSKFIEPSSFWPAAAKIGYPLPRDIFALFVRPRPLTSGLMPP